MDWSKLFRNWKTTTAGVAMILSVAPKMADPQTLTLQDLTTIAGGVGLLAAKDFDRSHTQLK
jgi:hypothetical protein